MQLKKTPSSFSNFSSRNLTNQQQIEKALQKQLNENYNSNDINILSCSSGGNTHLFSKMITNNAKFNATNYERRILKIEIIRQEEQNKLKNQNDKKNALNYFPVYTTLMDSDFLVSPIIQNRGETISSSQPYRIKNSQEKMTHRRKLVPIKRIRNEKIQMKKPNVSFLSVQKAPFLNQDMKSFDHNSMTITANAFNRNKFTITKKSFQSQTAESQLNPQRERILLSKQEMYKLSRNRPFIPPFQRYSYFDFIWKVGHSNMLKTEFLQQLPKKYKAYIGGGNNSNLIKMLLRRRESWWVLTDKMQQANFIWTQIKVNNIFNSQSDMEAPPQNNFQYESVIQKTPIYKRNIKIMSQNQTRQWINYFLQNREVQQKLTPSFKQRNRILKKKSKYLCIEPDKVKVHNHFPRNYVLGNKKALFFTMKKYYECAGKNVFEYLPLTFHIQKGVQDPQYYTFLKYYYKKGKQINSSGSKARNIWIVKPGEFTNRGNGIIVCHKIQDIKTILKNRYRLQNGQLRTYIVQQYLQRPFLYYGRKFDIRHYMLITCVNGHVKGYWCELGYIRTTSYEYNINNGLSSVHLTNDAVQKLLPDYGKYQKGNKLSYQQFENYLKTQYNGKYSFFKSIYPKMKEIAHDSMRASCGNLLMDPTRKGHNFQIFGFDFMIDSKFHPWLIQINTNPCLQLNCPVLSYVIPTMLQNTLKITIDSIFPPPQDFQQKRPRFSNSILQQNKFQLLYDSTVQQKQLDQTLNENKNTYNLNLNFKEFQKEQEEVYEDDGVMLDD